MRKIYLYLILIAFLTVLACKNDQFLPSGYETLERENLGSVETRTFTATRVGEYWQNVQAGARPGLLLGEYNGYRAHVLLRFYPYFSLDSTDTINSAELVLEQFQHFGEGDSLIVNAYPNIDADWFERSVTFDFARDNYDVSQPVSRLAFSTDDSSQIRAPFSSEIVKEWVDLNDRNTGILLTMEPNAPFMVGLYAEEFEGLGEAYLHIAYTDADGVQDTIQVSALYDVSLFEFTPQRPENELLTDVNRFSVDNLHGFQSLVEFDISEIPLESTVHQAYLSLHVDLDASSTRSEGMAITANIVKDSLWTPESMVVDSVVTASTVAHGDWEKVEFYEELATLNMSSIVQLWTLGLNQNYGFLINSAESGLDPSHITFISDLQDTLRAPKLVVTYSVPASSRFEY